MDALDLFPCASWLLLNGCHLTGSGLRLELTVIAASADCPLCGQPSNRVHSRYGRTLADLPCSGLAVRLEVQARKFFCGNPQCRRHIFVEPLAGLAARWARRTLRLQETLRWIGLLVGGESGARLSQELHLKTSPDTLLRAVQKETGASGPTPLSATPRVLGVDDFALRRGCTYGTLLVDLEQRRRVDLLPDRRPETFAAWLQAHPGVEIISRDRSEAYADGARQGAPGALQVADRWHLLKNLGQALERLLIREHHAVREAVQTNPADASATAAKSCKSVVPLASEDAVDIMLSEAPSSRKVVEQRARRARRLARYQQVIAAHQQGLTIRAIERRLGCSRKTVRRYLRYQAAGHGPARITRAPQPTQLQPFHETLHERWQQGCHNAAQLWRELKAQGYGGSQTSVKDYVRTLRSPMALAERRSRAPALRVPSARTAVWLLLRAEEELEPEQRQFTGRLTQLSSSICAARGLARWFLALVRKRRASELEDWMAAVEQSGLPDLKNFAKGLLRDKEAVLAGLSLEWSNGQTEGQVNRLKLIKRQMYGRAKFPLLRARVLAAA